VPSMRQNVLTPTRYSTARSGLLKLALKARTTSSRGKPISIILLIDASKAFPVTKLGSVGAAGALESETGAASAESVVVGGAISTSSVLGTGAGAAGVLAGGWTAATEVDADVDATGAALACN
jgi:hypothetical protein